MTNSTITVIDQAVRAAHEANPEPRRGHLGASGIGNRCARQTWYGFRWAYAERHTGRILRLFSRGHEEEDRFARWLRMAGVEVQDYAQRLGYLPKADTYVCSDWETPIPPHEEGHCVDVSQSSAHIKLAAGRGMGPKQWHFEDFGHFAGSSDGRIRAREECRLPLPDGWGLLECKTHGDKSFKLLSAKGVMSSKPTHYVQMQIYMHYFDLSWAFYFAVNKNDDTLYAEVVYYREEIALPYVAAASKIIEAKQPPKRLTEDPSWWECKFCAYREICHYAETPQKNCRSCTFAAAEADGSWSCGKFDSTIPKDFIPKGCIAWEPIG